MATITPPNHPSGSTGAHLSITVDELMQLRLVALGSQLPSLIIRGGTILALHTGELLSRDVVIHGRHIAAVTPWNYFPTTNNEINASGKFISPGFIDAHIHIEYTKLVPGELARLSVPRGTTTVLADANCIANVFGGRGMDFMGEHRSIAPGYDINRPKDKHRRLFVSSGRFPIRFLAILQKLSLAGLQCRQPSYVRESQSRTQLLWGKVTLSRWILHPLKSRQRHSTLGSESQAIQPC